MPKPKLPAVTDQHTRLVTEALPLAMDVLIETMKLESYETITDDKGIERKKFNGRIHSQKLRAALGTGNLIKGLGDQALKRQAGTQLKNLLAAMKRERKIAKAKTINGHASESPPGSS